MTEHRRPRTWIAAATRAPHEDDGSLGFVLTRRGLRVGQRITHGGAMVLRLRVLAANEVPPTHSPQPDTTGHEVARHGEKVFVISESGTIYLFDESELLRSAE
jgi:hypothetical protein